MVSVREDVVLYVNPDCVALFPPVAVIAALRVAVVFARDDAATEVRVGAAHADVVKVVFVPYEVPAVFVEYERTLYVVLHARPDTSAVYAPVPNEPDSVVVAPYAVVRP